MRATLIGPGDILENAGFSPRAGAGFAGANLAPRVGGEVF
jgi:hypothetical protein